MITTPDEVRSGFKPLSFGRNAGGMEAFVENEIFRGGVKPLEVAPEVSGMKRPMTVLLAERNAGLLKASFHGDKETFCPPIWADLAIGSGACGFGCRSCFLMLTFRAMRDPMRPYVYTNVGDFRRAAERWLKAKSWAVEKFGTRPRSAKDSIGLGIDCADSLLWEGVTGHARSLIPLFTNSATNPLGNPLVLLTKSANVHYLRDLQERDLNRVGGKIPNVVVTMSLNPEAIADLWEGKFPDTLERMTPPIEKRLAALREAQDLGFEVRARIDPILTPTGWQDHYRSFFAAMVNQFGLRPSMLTLGTYREKNEQLDTFRRKWGLPAMEWQASKTHGREGTHVHANERVATYLAVRDMAFSAFRGSGHTPHVSLCKETHVVRREVDLCNPHCNCLNANPKGPANDRFGSAAVREAQ